MKPFNANREQDWVEKIANRSSPTNFPLRTYPVVFRTITIVEANGMYHTAAGAVCASCQGSRIVVTEIRHYRAEKVEICRACGGLG